MHDVLWNGRGPIATVEVDSSIPVTGEHGQVPLLEVFEGRRQLIAYYHMWHTGKPAHDQCSGCTFCNGQVSEISYLHSRDVTFATISEGPYQESARYREFMGTQCPGTRRALRGRAARRSRVRHAGLLPARRQPGIRDLLDHRPGHGGDGLRVRAARHDGVRAAGDL